MAEDEYFEDKDLIKMALRSPELIMDNYDAIENKKDGKKAYKIASKQVFINEGNI